MIRPFTKFVNLQITRYFARKLFSSRWYLAQYGDVADHRMPPIHHYFKYGMKELRSPSPYFSPEWYIETYDDIAQSGLHPLEHYWRFGWKEGRMPSPFFNPDWYLDQNSDVKVQNVEPLSHYLTFGWREGRKPNVLLWLDWYKQQFQQFPSDIEPMEHYLLYGWKLGKTPNPLFSPEYYLDSNQIENINIEPLTHYLTVGWKEGFHPHSLFAPKAYEASEGVDPLTEYLAHNINSRPDILLRKLSSHNDNFKKARILGSVTPLEELYKKYPTVSQSLIANDSKAIAHSVLQELTQSTYVIVLSHDNYTENVGGVQIRIFDEQLAANSNEVGFLQISPSNPKPIFAHESDKTPVTVVVNGKTLCIADGNAFTQALRLINRDKILQNIVVHHLLGFKLSWINSILETFNSVDKYFWVHDYFTICPSIQLLRNKISYCHAPHIESNSCQLCVFGEERAKYLPQIRQLFQKHDFHVIAPSQFALDLWLKQGFQHIDNMVVPHISLELDTDVKQQQELQPIRIGFLGYPSFHKGWDFWIKLVENFAHDPRYEFYHFGSYGDSSLNHTFVEVSVTRDHRNAMIDALTENNIDVAFIGSIWPETFCYTMHEAYAAGCFVIGHVDSGNVQNNIDSDGKGILFESESDLFTLFLTDKLTDQLNTYFADNRKRGYFKPNVDNMLIYLRNNVK